MQPSVMESWPALPDAPLAAGGPCSEALLRCGCPTYRDAARYLCELPYRRNSDRADYRLVLREACGTCSTKHALLAAVAAEQGLPVALVLGIYDMDGENTPGVGPVLEAHGLRSVPEAHCYLVHDGARVDVTASGREAGAALRLHEERRITPAQIGSYKTRLHRRFLARWREAHPEVGLSVDELWAAREACIRALGSRTGYEVGAPPSGRGA